LGDVIVEVDERYFRPTEVETLLGDPSKARREMGWEPAVTVETLINEMVREDLVRANRGAVLLENGFA
jgi:GDPmannose 4,6-dehydratase